MENLAVTFVDLGLDHVCRLEVGLNRKKAVQRVPKSVEKIGKLFFGIELFGCFQDLINGYGTDQVVKAIRRSGEADIRVDADLPLMFQIPR